MRRTKACCAFCSLVSLVSDLSSVFAAPEPDTGKSRTCPTLERTIKSFPRYLLMVLALAGDSTITKALPCPDVLGAVFDAFDVAVDLGAAAFSAALVSVFVSAVSVVLVDFLAVGVLLMLGSQNH